MKFKNPLLVVSDIERSVSFYKKVLGLNKTVDLGANVTLTGGVCMQTKESWISFIENDNITYGGNDFELYFEEEDFDSFIKKLSSLDIKYVHKVKEHSWGQRVVRFYDPDMHIIEVGEDIKAVTRRFIDSGMTIEQVAERMDVPLTFVKRGMK
ncbi:MAG: VOC family protein [Clostridia bacterium]